MLHILKIKIDGHVNGLPPERPWVAEITGPDPKFGVARTFLKPHNDWAGASVAWSGNTYGVVAHFALHEGRLYEASRYRGRSSRRRLVREYYRADSGTLAVLDPEEALSLITGPGVDFRISEDRSGTSWVARVTGLGTPERCPFLVVDTHRTYCLPCGLYEVVESGRRRFLGVNTSASQLTAEEAQAWLVNSNVQ